jgi:hypothetical protein
LRSLRSANAARFRDRNDPIEQGHLPQAIVVRLFSASKRIQSTLNVVGLGGLDTTARGVLALPLYALSVFELGRIGPKLPLR